MKSLTIVAGVATLLSANAASASPIKLTVTGKITGLSALQDYQPTSLPTGIINVGDDFTLMATFDPSMAILTSLYDADPSINIYYFPGTNVQFNSGAYNLSFNPTTSNSSVQLWNNYSSGAVVDTDSQSFSYFAGNLSASSIPFDLGNGQRSITLGFYEFDYSATARSNDLLPLVSPDLFNSRIVEFGVLNSTTNLFVNVGLNVTSATLGAVPEPAAWALMIVGFGMVGGSMRYRRRSTRTVYQAA